MGGTEVGEGGAERSRRLSQRIAPEGFGRWASPWVATCGDFFKFTMKATVKEHSEYKGTKQTVITRPKIKGIRKGE